MTARRMSCCSSSGTSLPSGAASSVKLVRNESGTCCWTTFSRGRETRDWLLAVKVGSDRSGAFTCGRHKASDSLSPERSAVGAAGFNDSTSTRWPTEVVIGAVSRSSMA